MDQRLYCAPSHSKNTGPAVKLTEKQKRFLKSQAHHLKVVVQSGAAGLTPAVLAEIDSALTAHELLKVRLVAEEREDRQAMIDEICRATGAEAIQRVGHVATFYRRHPDKPRIQLPKG